MSALVVWMDHEHAKIFALSPEKMETHSLKKHEVRHHTSHDEQKHKNAEGFFHELASELKGASELLLVGPGLAKAQFKHHLENHHHQDLAKKVVGMETCDHPTDNQILDLGRKFFKKYDLFYG